MTRLNAALADPPSEDAAPVMAPPRLAPERAMDGPAVEALMRRAFGPGHFAKVSERLREGNRMRADLSFCAFIGGELAGAVRLWPVRAGGAPFLFLGPIGVDEAARGEGVAGRLIEAACAAAAVAGEPLIALVGARALFEPHGFGVVPDGRIVLPGPVDTRRMFWKPLRQGGETGVAGPVRIAPDLGRDPT